ncbi:MAG TPA: Uma2 family endonuclease [Acetobacteraceae bacterium]|nr:Uma2 family endonuclease [Acetobacteraceae bacterium]
MGSRPAIRFEPVDGEVYVMAGETPRHDTISNNLRGEIRTQLRGKPWRVQGPDRKVRAGRDGRYPDALIDCGPNLHEGPEAVIEIADLGIVLRIAAIYQGIVFEAAR